MSTLTFAHLRQVNVSRCVTSFNHSLESWTLADWVIATGGEVGEALNVIKKLNRERDGIIGNSKNKAELLVDLGDELADAVIYTDLLLARERLHFTGQLNFGDLQGEARRALAAAPKGFTLSDAGEGTLRGIGDLAAATHSGDGGRITRAALTLLLELAGIAELAGIDLGAAVVRKFNLTSEKRGAAERLTA